ncbi:hypothetical protein CPAV1605_884 [seawater metagenome]|uniref:Uncharacterized protein n=1 Tax=seawater metagenome TaxID=1561972 RepID=A0A5E8CKG1_9ZZZZ
MKIIMYLTILILCLFAFYSPPKNNLCEGFKNNFILY